MSRYQIHGEHARFPEPGSETSTEALYFSKGGTDCSLSSLLRSMAWFVERLPELDSVEAISVYPEFRNGDDADRWAGIVTVYRDKKAIESGVGTPSVA